MASQVKTPPAEGGRREGEVQAPALKEILEKRIYEDKEIMKGYGYGKIEYYIDDVKMHEENIDEFSDVAADFEFQLATIYEETVKRVVAEELELNIEELSAEYDPDFADYIDIYFRDELLVSVKACENFNNQMTGYQRIEYTRWLPLRKVIEDLKEELKPLKQLLSEVETQVAELNRAGVIALLLDKALSNSNIDFDVVKTYRSGNSNVVATTYQKDIQLKRFAVADFNIFKPIS